MLNETPDNGYYGDCKYGCEDVLIIEIEPAIKQCQACGAEW